MNTQYLEAVDGHRIALHQSLAEGKPNGVLVWLHGMAEHGARYTALASAANAAGWHLYCPDHRGHGASVADHELRGHFADANGWNLVLEDVATVLAHVRQQHERIPLVLGGHSMGSFIALSFAEQHGGQLDGLVLCGSDYKSPWLWKLARLPVMLERRRHGPRGTSNLLRALSFDAFARKIPHRRTDFDWLSRDAAEVDRYINDPWCGHDCTAQLWFDLIDAMTRVDALTTMKQLPVSVPILLIGGDGDPMSAMGKGMTALYRALHRAGVADLTFGQFTGGRHEILNDLCRDEVHEELLGWLTQHFS